MRPPPPGDAKWKNAVFRVHRALIDGGYRAIAHVPTSFNPLAFPLEGVNLAGFLAQRGRRLMEPSAVPGLYRAIERTRSRSREKDLRFWFLGETVPLAEVPEGTALLESGVIEHDGDGVRARLRFIPAGELLLAVDRLDRTIENFTYLGRDSLVFAERLRSALAGRAFARALDLCTGAGIQALTAAAYAERVEGTDINPRAIAFARLNAELAGFSDRVSFRANDLAAGLEGPYDLIVANPPYVWMPEEKKRENMDGFGGELGLEVVRRILVELDRLLSERGEAHFVCEAPVLSGRSVLDSVAAAAIKGSRLRVTLTPLWYAVHRNLQAFHKTRGVSHVVYYHVSAMRAPSTQLEIEKLSPMKHALYSAYVRLAGLAS